MDVKGSNYFGVSYIKFVLHKDVYHEYRYLRIKKEFWEVCGVSTFLQMLHFVY